MKRYKTGFCTRCNAERPLRPRRDERRTRHYHCIVCGDRVELPNKFMAVRTASRLTPGVTFDSREESKREPTLIAQQNAGQIRNLRMSAWKGEKRTERYVLTVYGNEAVEQLMAAALEAAERLKGAPPMDWRMATVRRIEAAVADLQRARHKITTYRPDATYNRCDTDALVVEDVKVIERQHFREKRRLMLACHNVEVQVIRGDGRNLYGRMR